MLRFDELNQSDIVVHREHGLGVYQGLVTLTLKNITNDFLEIRYEGEDKLYVPVDRLNSIYFIEEVCLQCGLFPPNGLFEFHQQI